jgi:hypothetical protein
MQEDFSASERADLDAAYLLLAGDTIKNAKGLLEKSYLAGREELAARQALARLLRSQKPLDSLLRLMLAALFDRSPTGDKAIDDFFATDPIERKIFFKSPAGRGNQAKRHFAIAERIIAQKRSNPDRTLTDIKADLANQTDLTEEAIDAAYKRFKKRVQGNPPRSR